jgi:hypothetical protein
MAETSESTKSVGEKLVYAAIPIFLAASVICGLGILVVMRAKTELSLGGGLVTTCIGATFAFGAVLVGIRGAVQVAMSQGVVTSSGGGGGDMSEAVPLLRTISDRLMVSDAAKRIAYREKDLEALRKAISDDINVGKFDASLALVQEMENTYGYKAEADHFREEIIDARDAVVEREVQKGMEEIDRAITEADWDRISTLANRLRRTFPEHPRCRHLPSYIKERKEQHKTHLEKEFLQAAERDDVTRAEQLLKELDKYLTPEEAEPFRETARAVFGKKRKNLGVQFKLALDDKDWAQAIAVGEEIIKEFPNSKMAEEFKGVRDALHERLRTQKTPQS